MKNLFLFFLIIISLNINSQNIQDGLLLEYLFEGNMVDSSGNSNDGTNFGATLTDDRFGNPNSAILFDGINDYVNFPNISQLKPDLPVSFSFWIRYDSDDPDDRDVFNTSYEEDVNSGVYFNSQASTGKYAVNFGDGSSTYISSTRRTYVSTEIIDTGNWHNITIIVAESLDMKIYVDCFYRPSGVFSGSGGDLNYSDEPGVIGRHDRTLTDPANYFKGAIDDFRYWDREISPLEMLQVCESQGGLSIEKQHVSESKSFVVYPNPTDGELFFSGENMNYNDITIYNVLGEKVYDSDFSLRVDVSYLKSGVYFLSIDGGVIVKKLILN